MASFVLGASGLLPHGSAAGAVPWVYLGRGQVGGDSLHHWKSSTADEVSGGSQVTQSPPGCTCCGTKSWVKARWHSSQPDYCSLSELNLGNFASFPLVRSRSALWVRCRWNVSHSLGATGCNGMGIWDLLVLHWWVLAAGRQGLGSALQRPPRVC